MNTPENEKQAAPTTIVGGRPTGSERRLGTIPRGLEVLVKKASVDPQFRELLFQKRAGAAATIALELDPAELAMLEIIPSEQLAQIVDQTLVPVEQRRVFLGQVAAAMLAVLAVGLAGCGREPEPPTRGIRPEEQHSKGMRPDRPSNNDSTANQ